MQSYEMRRLFFDTDKDFIAEVRSTGKFYDEEFVTDGIIIADLHSEVSGIMCCAETGKPLCSEDKKRFILHLCGSICTALNSRVKNECFAKFRCVDWLACGTEFHVKAARL